MCRSHHLWRVTACIPPIGTITYPVQVPINLSLKLEVTGFSGRGVIAPFHQQPCSGWTETDHKTLHLPCCSMWASTHLSPRLIQIQSVSPSLSSIIFPSLSSCFCHVITCCTLSATHQNVICSIFLFFVHKTYYHPQRIFWLSVFSLIAQNCKLLIYKENKEAPLIYQILMLVAAFTETESYHSPLGGPVNQPWFPQLSNVIVRGSGKHWITRTTDAGATLLHNNKNECCLFDHWFKLFFSFPSPSVMKLGSTPRQSREVYLYLISSKTLVHRLLVDVICCTGVVVRLVSVSASDSICINTPHSKPIGLLCEMVQCLLSVFIIIDLLNSSWFLENLQPVNKK